jgi:hypothetical protein
MLIANFENTHVQLKSIVETSIWPIRRVDGTNPTPIHDTTNQHVEIILID